jgi:hypothetical protein
MLLVGEWNAQEWVAAASVATVAAALAETARTRAGASPREGARVLAHAWSVPPLVVVDFALLMWALVLSAARRRVVRGGFVDADAPDAWTQLLATYSPNAYVVLDTSMHRLLPFARSQEPA